MANWGSLHMDIFRFIDIFIFQQQKVQDGFLQGQTTTSTVSFQMEGYIVKNGGYRIESEERRV